MTGELAVRAAGITRRFDGRVALEPLDFDLRLGEIVALVGPNGAGKSTLLALLAGALPPNGGRIEWRGDLRIGWVPQRPAHYARLSARENLELFARLERLPEPRAAAERLLAALELPRDSRPSGELSVGNRQRLNVAIGLLPDPDVLLLDEPTAALDPRQRERLWEFIRALADAGTTVIYSTHNVQEAERYGERVAVLADGELVFAGSPRELERVVAETPHGEAADFEAAFVAFLRQRGH